MCNFLSKLIFLRRKPKVIIVSGSGSSLTVAAIFQVLKEFFKVKNIENKVKLKDVLKNDILIFGLAEKISPKKFKFLLKNSSQPILVITNLGEILPESIVFASEKSDSVEFLAGQLPAFGYLVLNFDDETVRATGDKLNVHTLTFGFGEGANLRASDWRVSREGTTFKLNFDGNILPVWLPNLFGKKNIYGVLATLTLGHIFNLNLVKISQILRSWPGIEGEGKIIDGIKDTVILDDSKNASPFSMREALEILGETKKGTYPEQSEGRKIAVLGDILGIGKYTIEAHEAIGERVVKNADLLFTVGERAKFIAEAAREKGMDPGRIFEFNDTSRAGLALQDKMRQGDLVLVDGSKEMEMEKIVKEVRKIDV